MAGRCSGGGRDGPWRSDRDSGGSPRRPRLDSSPSSRPARPPRRGAVHGAVHDVEGLRRFGRLDAVLRARTRSTRTNVSRLERAWFYPVAGDAARLPFNPIVVDGVMYVAGAKGVVVALDAATGKADVDVDRAGSRARSHLLGERRSIRSAAAAQHRRRPPRDRRDQRHAHQVVRQERVRRHAYGRAATAGRAQQDSRPHLRKPDRRRIQHRRRLRIAARRSARVRRGHRPAGLDVPHHSASGRVRLRHLAARRVEVRRRRQHVGRDHDRQQERHRVRPDRLADARSLRRGSRAATTCLATACSRSTRAPASGSGISRPCTTICGTTISPPRPSSSPCATNGKPIEIVAQAGKTGFLYVFERLTGKPLWPIEERAVPKSDVPGEVSSPTQPFPTKPPPFARQVFTPDDVNPFMSAEEQEKLRQAVRDTDHKGHVHAVEPPAPSHSVSRRVGRRELGKRGGRSGNRHALRAQPGDAELSPDGAQHGASGTAADQGRPA